MWFNLFYNDGNNDILKYYRKIMKIREILDTCCSDRNKYHEWYFGNSGGKFKECGEADS